MGYLNRSYAGDVLRPTTCAMTALGRLKASKRAEMIDVGVGRDGSVYASALSDAFDRAVSEGLIAYVGRYGLGASVGDVAEDIEFVWKTLDKSQPSVILDANINGAQT